MIRAPHGDRHGLWIAPNDPDRMIESDDGGATISYERRPEPGRSEDNQPTAQFYRVALDNDFPTTSTARSRTTAPCASPAAATAAASASATGIRVGGGESGWIAPDPRNSQIVYAGSYDGLPHPLRPLHRTVPQHQRLAR